MLLLALASYFGTDILAILLVASMVMIPGFVFRDRFANMLKKTGHELANPGCGLPFVPAIFLATSLIVFAPRPEWLKFNAMMLSLYKSYFLNSFLLGHF